MLSRVPVTRAPRLTCGGDRAFPRPPRFSRIWPHFRLACRLQFPGREREQAMGIWGSKVVAVDDDVDTLDLAASCARRAPRWSG